MPKADIDSYQAADGSLGGFGPFDLAAVMEILYRIKSFKVSCNVTAVYFDDFYPSPTINISVHEESTNMPLDVTSNFNFPVPPGGFENYQIKELDVFAYNRTNPTAVSNWKSTCFGFGEFQSNILVAAQGEPTVDVLVENEDSRGDFYFLQGGAAVRTELFEEEFEFCEPDGFGGEDCVDIDVIGSFILTSRQRPNDQISGPHVGELKLHCGTYEFDFWIEWPSGTPSVIKDYTNVTGATLLIEADEWFEYATTTSAPAWDSATGDPINGGPGA